MITDITNRKEIIDGEEVYVLDNTMKAGMEKILEMPECEEGSFVLPMLKNDIAFMCKHPNFAIAFRPINLRISKWLPCMIYKHESGWRRVLIEYVDCLKCDWKGIGANPTNSDLYFALHNKFEILKSVSQLSFCKCPQCGSGLSTRAIWIEKLTDIEDNT